jgi:hypothetical protein
VSFTGRDEEITDERRSAQRYTLSHLAHDVKNQTGIGEPTRDWFPISFMSTFADWADLVHGPTADWGALSCGCHPNCGVGMAVIIDKETSEAVPITAFLNGPQLAQGHPEGQRCGARPFLSVAGMALALMRNYDPFKTPKHFKVYDLLRRFDKAYSATGRDYGKVTADRTIADIEFRRSDRFNYMFVAGMWFQDLFNYDFRRTNAASFRMRRRKARSASAPTTRHRLAEHHREDAHDGHAHQVVRGARASRDLRGGKKVALDTNKHSLQLVAEDVNKGLQHDLDDKGIAKTAREEKLRARKAQVEHERMAALYRQEVLKEPKPEITTGLQIQGLKKAVTDKTTLTH